MDNFDQQQHAIVPRGKTSDTDIFIVNAGANRGAEKNLPAIAAFNRESDAKIIPAYVDPVPGRSQNMRQKANALGVKAIAIQSKIEDLVLEEKSRAPIVLNMDRPKGVATLLKTSDQADRSVLGYMLGRFNLGPMRGFRFLLRPEDKIEREKAIAFFDTLSEVTAPRGSDGFWGHSGRSDDRLNENRYRQYFADHFRKNIPKVVSDLELDSPGLEMTMDGVKSLPLLLEYSPSENWYHPMDLAQKMAVAPPLPLLRGESFCVVEIQTLVALRFHVLYLRKTDGHMEINGENTFSSPSITLEHAAERAMTRAEQTTVTKVTPALTTD